MRRRSVLRLAALSPLALLAPALGQPQRQATQIWAGVVVGGQMLGSWQDDPDLSYSDSAGTDALALEERLSDRRLDQGGITYLP
jgi:hypothetical protein